MSLGCITGGYMMQKYGRKSAQLFGALPAILGWTIVYYSTTITLLLTGRFLKGLSAGILAPPTTVYIGEIALPKYRGFLLAALILALSFGMFLVHFMGTFLTWQLTALLNISFPAIGFLLLWFAPESPSWLTKKGRLEKAEEKFLWCKGESNEAKKEIAAMLQRQQEQEEIKDWKKIVLKRHFLKPMLIIVVFLIATQFTGVNAITFYSVSIAQSAVGDDYNEYTIMLIIDALRVLASLLACILLRKMGRRPLALLSGIGSTISLVSLAAFTCLSKLHQTFPYYSLLSLTSLIGYICFVMLGLTPLPWTMLGELLPLNTREYGSGVASSFAFIAMFIVVKCNPFMFESVGVSGTFLIYGAVALMETVFLFVLLPETKNKTLQEVEDSFRRKKLEEIGMYCDDRHV